jgi:hypothetical protein
MGGGDVSFGSMDQSEVEADVLDREGDDAEGHEVVRWGDTWLSCFVGLGL